MLHVTLLLVFFAACHGVPTLPHWTPTYDMQQSTIIMPCNTSGQLDPQFFSQFGIVDVDWSNMKAVWDNQHPMNSSGLMIEQAMAIRAINPNTRVWVYRNLVKALPWLTCVREKLEDPAYSGWFLSFDPAKEGHYAQPPCDLHRPDPTAICSTLYHDQRETPEAKAYCWHNQSAPGCGDVYVPWDPSQFCTEPCDCGKMPCGEYVFDHRNASLRQWLLDVYIGGNEGIGHPDISGIFIDDSWSAQGPSEIDGNCVSDTGLTKADVTDMTAAWAANMAAVQEYIIANGAMNWQLFAGQGTLQGPPFEQGNAASCSAYFRNVACVPNSTLQHTPLMYGIERNHDYPPFKYIVSFEQSLAAFLLARGPFAWYGYSWVSCYGDFGRGGAGMPPLNITFPPALKEDYGTPLGECAETTHGSGTFTREWSKATVELNCNDWTSTITPK
eukprot:m.176861 g.176861  ORF g.176861 m.176861 type:complete len:442 (+) comp31864_c0_seq2:206-1531(+)